MLSNKCSVSICGLLKSLASKKVIFSIFSACFTKVILSLSGGRMALAGSMPPSTICAGRRGPPPSAAGCLMALPSPSRIRPKQDVLDADVVVSQAQGLLTAEADDFADPG
jgi:hypothetical protein